MLLLLVGGYGHTAVSASTPTPTIHIPHFVDAVPLSERAIFWFGELSNSSNYADVRVGYNDDNIVVQVPVYDRLLYFDNTPTVAELPDWDSVSLYLNLDGNSGGAPTSSSYWFIGQHNKTQGSTTHYGVYQGNGSGWTPSALSFEFNSGTQASGFNDQDNDRGYWVSFVIPFSSLGLSQRPSPQTIWGAAIAVHDRDSDSSNIPDQLWPTGVDDDVPGSYGRFSFGTPQFEGTAVPNPQTTIIRQGENGITVPDGDVGGHVTCGHTFWPDKYFSDWGDANYAGAREVNIQNQFNLWDWPCFSKYYVTFPLDSVPTGKVIRSATLSMYQFGNAGQNSSPTPQPTLIQVMRTTGGFNDATVTWNNGPQVMENVASAWAGTIPAGGEGFFVEWDVSRAVADAMAEGGGPLHLALFTADANRNSGKYFVSSEGASSKLERRPTLIIEWGDPPLQVTPALRQVEMGGTAVYTISADGLGETVSLSVQNPNPGALDISLDKTIITPPETAVLTITDMVNSEQLYEIVVEAEGDVVGETTVYFLVGGSQLNLPYINNP